MQPMLGAKQRSVVYLVFTLWTLLLHNEAHNRNTHTYRSREHTDQAALTRSVIHAVLHDAGGDTVQSHR